MLPFHDVNFARRRQFEVKGYYDVQRFENLPETIQDLNLFLMFIIIDGSTPGKNPQKPASFSMRLVNISISILMNRGFIKFKRLRRGGVLTFAK